jgi:hypothetical protein
MSDSEKAYFCRMFLGILMPLELPMGTSLIVCDRIILDIYRHFENYVITVITV